MKVKKKINCKDGLTPSEEIKARRIKKGLQDGNEAIINEFNDYLTEIYIDDIEKLDLYMLICSPKEWYSAVKRTPEAKKIAYDLYYDRKNK